LPASKVFQLDSAVVWVFESPARGKFSTQQTFFDDVVMSENEITEGAWPVRGSERGEGSLIAVESKSLPVPRVRYRTS
jgi:hypothetical protein